MVRNGKIARLPRPRRDELNRRLAANEDGATLLDWLNAAPDVKDLLARDFAGEPVSRQNLHEWLLGGFAEWQTRQNLFAAAADLTDANGEWDALAANDFTERLAAVLVVRYADALAGWNGGDDEAFRLKLRDLRRFNQDLAVLRRYNQTAARLKMEQLPFYREETKRAEAAASARRQSEAGARAYDERQVQRRREAEAAQKSTSPFLAAPVPDAPSAPAAPVAVAVATPTHPADRTAATVPASISDAGSPRSGSESGKALSTQSAANVAPAGVESSDAGKNMAAGAAVMAAGLIRANLVIKFTDSLRQASKIIEARSSQALNLRDRRAVQEAYAGSVATTIRLGREAGVLRAHLPAFAEVDRLSAAIEVLKREYLGMKSSLFQGLPAALAAGIQQVRDAAGELGQTLQCKAATAASLAAQAA
jgi:hypothetical protein